MVAAVAAGPGLGVAWPTPQAGLQESTTSPAERLAREQLATARDLLASRQVEESLEAYRTAVALYPSVETHAALGSLYFKLAVRSKAYIQFRKAVELDPYNADLWLDLASAEHIRGAIGESWRAARMARNVEPGIQIERDENGFYRRASNDSRAHVSKGSYLGRGIP